MKNARTILMLSAVLMLVTGSAVADWDPGDGHKMHFPQLPDPNGWDVNVSVYGLADDWKCSQTGLVEDIHFWVSWKGDLEVMPFSSITLEIFDDDRSGPFSKPGEQLWFAYLWPGMGGTLEMAYRPYGEGDQGWLDPVEGVYVEYDHQNYYQVNCTNFTAPFEQEEGKIYWLGVSIVPQSGEVGWKTSKEEQFEDDAVYLTWDMQAGKNIWLPLIDPINGESLDLAFVITPEPATMGLLALGACMVLLRRRRS